MKANPPWLTDLVGDFWDTLEGKVPPEWLPKLTEVRGARGRVVGELKEFGCGNYGCVLPTQSPDVVLKVTTDASEIQYAAHIAKSVPVDVTTEYFLVVGLNTKIDKRPVALLWREAADHVGEIQRAIPRGKRAVSLIVAQHRQASRILLGHSKGLTASVMQPFIAGWLQSLDAMAEIDELRFVALGMRQCFAEEGVMFLDVHEGNLGRVLREGEYRWVITDPGNVVRLEQQGHALARAGKRRNPAPSWAQSEDQIAAFEYEQAVREALLQRAPPAIKAGIGDDDVFSTMSPSFQKMIDDRLERLQIAQEWQRGDIGSPAWVVLRADPYTEAWKDQRISTSPAARRAGLMPFSRADDGGNYHVGPKIAELFDEVCEDLDDHWRPSKEYKWVWDALMSGSVGYFVFKLYSAKAIVGRKEKINNPHIDWRVVREMVPPLERWFKMGMLVRVRRTIDRFPDFSVPTGVNGVVTDDSWDDKDRAYASVQMSVDIPGAEDWGNEVIWMPDHVEHHELATDQENMAAELRADLEPAIFKVY